MRLGRLIWVGLAFRVKELTRSGLFVFTSVIEPLIFATLTYYLFNAGSKSETVVPSSTLPRRVVAPLRKSAVSDSDVFPVAPCPRRTTLRICSVLYSFIPR